MFGFDIKDGVVMQQSRVLEQALSTNPKTQEALQKLIQRALKDIRPEMVAAARSAMKSDPRGAANGIRLTVYRKILGGNINILNRRSKAGSVSNYEPPRKLQPGQRGGNRVPRGERTNTVMHYGPIDRQWILRFINSGTGERTAGTRGGRLSGNRGSIAPRNFFRGAGERALTKAADNLATLIDTELEAMLNKKSTA